MHEMERIFLGSARVSRAGDDALVIANFSKDCFGEGAEVNTRGRECSVEEERALFRI
jgi:hypothetical protein